MAPLSGMTEQGPVILHTQKLDDVHVKILRGGKWISLVIRGIHKRRFSDLGSGDVDLIKALIGHIKPREFGDAQDSLRKQRTMVVDKEDRREIVITEGITISKVSSF